jgi:hypothetical protein
MAASGSCMFEPACDGVCGSPLESLPEYMRWGESEKPAAHMYCG